MDNETGFKKNDRRFSLKQLLCGAFLISTIPFWFHSVLQFFLNVFSSLKSYGIILSGLFFILFFSFLFNLAKKKYLVSFAYFIGALLTLFIMVWLVKANITRCGRSSYEASVIGSLRTINTSQVLFQNAGLKDRDSDGIGEFGTFVELSGTVPIPSGRKSKKPKPAYISSVFGATSSSSHGIASRSGYLFKMYLPSSGKSTIGENVIYSGTKKMPKANDIFDLSTNPDALDGKLLIGTDKTSNKLIWNLTK